MISAGDLKKLSDLARLENDPAEAGKLTADLEKILSHFGELASLDTEKIEPLAGGSFVEDVLRPDEAGKNSLSGDKAKNVFPEKEKSFLKVPPVFE